MDPTKWTDIHPIHHLQGMASCQPLNTTWERSSLGFARLYKVFVRSFNISHALRPRHSQARPQAGHFAGGGTAICAKGLPRGVDPADR